MNSKTYIGKNEQDVYVFQDIEDGKIRGFMGYMKIELVDGSEALENTQWTHKMTVNGLTYETGGNPAPTMNMPKEIVGLYEVETISCDDCGAAHDSQQYGSQSFMILNDCEVYCKGCVTAEMALVEVKQPADMFKAKDVQSVDLDGYEEIDTLFCDASGFGHEGELALTKSQAIDKVKSVLAETSSPVYAGITDMGQFQVYVTLFRKAA